MIYEKTKKMQHDNLMCKDLKNHIRYVRNISKQNKIFLILKIVYIIVYRTWRK